MPTKGDLLYKRMSDDIQNYLTGTVEIAEGVQFSQYKLIKRIFKFKNRDLTGSKINEDLSYNYWFDITSPRVDSSVKNLRFDTKHILAFSQNPYADFPAVFLTNASLKSWMMENGEDEKLKAAVEEFVENGNVIFKKIDGGYETCDALNTYVTNQKAQHIDDTNLIERYELTASQLKRMITWDSDAVDRAIMELGEKSRSATENSTDMESSTKIYEIFEYTGEVSEQEFNEIKQQGSGDEHTYFLAKVIVAGLRDAGGGEKITLFAERLPNKKKLSDFYIAAHYGSYKGRFWRLGVYEILFDHQIRANEIGNQLARGLDWASRVIFRTSDPDIMQNIRADLDNGDIIRSTDLQQVDVRMRSLDQLIADWNRNNENADQLTNSFEVVRGEAMPSGTPFRSTSLLDENAGKMFITLRQKITLPYRRVFREWILPKLVKDLTAKDIFNFTGDIQILDQLREIMVNSWYVSNLAKIGPHTKEIADAIKAEQLDQLRESDPSIENVKELWEGVLPRIFITITGENSDLADNVQDMVSLLSLEQDPQRIAYLLDSIYRIRGIPIPPRVEQQPPEMQMDKSMAQDVQPEAEPVQQLGA